MLDAKIVIVGVAGIFVALGFAGAFLIGVGHITTAVGQAVDVGPVAQAGDALAGYGVDIIAVLIVMGILVLLAFLYLVFR